MPTTGGKELALGRIYSDSMLALAEAQGQADALLEELLDLAAYITQNADFAEFLSSPMIDSAARERFIEKMLRGKASDLLVDSLQVLNRKDRVELLPAIIEAYRLQLEELRGVVDVHVVTAVPLTDELRETVKNVAGKYAGKTAQLIESVA
ncbi:MAG: FoF1 ATP synthase subunit delta [Phycisphaerae bacterium]